MNEVSPTPVAAAPPVAEVWRRFLDEPLAPDPPPVITEPPPRRQVAPGQQLGPWEVVRPLGRGGMGEVFDAFYLPAHCHYALKILSGDHHDDPTARARFQNEYWALTVVKHPAIVAPFCAGEDDGIRWYAMELLKGASLDQVIDRALLSPLRAAQIGVAIADGLAAVHGAGIVHRDLKPANIFVLGDGRVKLLDLGIAKLLPEFYANAQRPPPVKDRLETLPGAPIGTPAFMAPEAILGEKASPAQDIYGLAATLFRAILGSQPYKSRFPGEGDEPRRSEELGRPIPEALEAVLRTALAVDPSRRYRTMEEFREDLELVAAELEADEEHVAAPSREPAAAVRAAAPTLIEAAAPTSEPAAIDSARGQAAIAIEPAARPSAADDLPAPLAPAPAHDRGPGPPPGTGQPVGLPPSGRPRAILAVALLSAAVGLVVGHVATEVDTGIASWARGVGAAARHLPLPPIAAAENAPQGESPSADVPSDGAEQGPRPTIAAAENIPQAESPSVDVPDDGAEPPTKPDATEAAPPRPRPRPLTAAAFLKLAETKRPALGRCERWVPGGASVDAIIRVSADGSVVSVKLDPDVSSLALACASEVFEGLSFPPADVASTHTWPIVRPTRREE